MGSVAKSAGGFLGIGPGGPTASVDNRNDALLQLDQQNSSLNDQGFLDTQNNYANGTESQGDAMKGLNQAQLDQLATGATTGSKFATEQVQNNPILGQLFGNQGLMGKEIGKEQDLQNQGFQLKPEDYDLYGQTSGNIARMFGAQGNQISQDLASRGLASAPSGIAGVMFSGLAGNQNEMLAQAQQQIMNQRVQDTLQRIGQQQNIISSLGAQGANDINQQYGRQLSGAQTRQDNLQKEAGLTTAQNEGANQADLQKSMFDSSHTPANFMDYAAAGTGSSIYNTTAAPGTAAQKAAGGGSGGLTSMGAAVK